MKSKTQKVHLADQINILFQMLIVMLYLTMTISARLTHHARKKSAIGTQNLL